ncbi:MAG: CBS domain-containing protein [Chitinophagales bacterium]|nr:CBS domain-containing protein [Chitinophagales bacterium]MDW8393564.1 CBS domain-containing protein [Chitinophagales bacterium]
MKVREILRRKGNEVVSVTPASTVLDALKKMAERNIGGVLVMEGETAVGIFTERDYARKIVLKGKTSADSLIRDVMVTDLITVTPDHDTSDCMKLMTNNAIRHLPVMENGKLVGLISIGDVVKAVIEEQQSTIQHLEQYIAGS